MKKSLTLRLRRFLPDPLQVHGIAKNLAKMAEDAAPVDDKVLKDQLMRLLLFHISDAATSSHALLRYIQEICKLAGLYVDTRSLRIGRIETDSDHWEKELEGYKKDRA